MQKQKVHAGNRTRHLPVQRLESTHCATLASNWICLFLYYKVDLFFSIFFHKMIDRHVFSSNTKNFTFSFPFVKIKFFCLFYRRKLKKINLLYIKEISISNHLPMWRSGLIPVLGADGAGFDPRHKTFVFAFFLNF